MPLADRGEAPLVYVVVLNWNGAGVLRECLDSLLAMNYPNFRVAVVDNASTDGAVERVRRRYDYIYPKKP